MLYHKDINLQPEARVFLWQWLNTIGPEGATNETLRELCKRLAITVRKGSRALAQLKECGAISATKQPQAQVIKASGTPEKRGRPRTWHCVSADTQQWLKPIDMGPDITRGLDKLISFAASSGDGMRDGEARKETLTLANSWLVAVLLAHMNHAGQVTTLGYADLMALTGMSRSRIQSQIKKLNAMGVLHHQPGSMRVVLGARLECSIFTLDLHHPQIGYERYKKWPVLDYWPCPAQKVEPYFTVRRSPYLPAANQAARKTWQFRLMGGGHKKRFHAVNGIVHAAAVLVTMQREHEERHKPAGLLGETPEPASESETATEEKEGKALATAQEDHEIRQEIAAMFPHINVRHLERWEYTFADAYRWLTYVHRYACWLLIHEAKALRSSDDDPQMRLLSQLRKDFPDMRVEDLTPIMVLAPPLANLLMKRLDDLKVGVAWFENITLLPVTWGTQVHWRLTGYLPDHSPVALPDNVLMTLESAGHDWESWLKRWASG